MGKAWLTINNLRKHIFRLRYAPGVGNPGGWAGHPYNGHDLFF